MTIPFKSPHESLLTPRTKQALLVTLTALCLLNISLSFAEPPLSKESTEHAMIQSHIELVEVALQTDFYNKRCRGVSVSKQLNKVNRLYVTKYSLTANNFIKLYIDPNTKQVKQARKHAFNKNLNALGGCQSSQAKEAMKQFKKAFKILYEQAEKSPWYPEQ